MLLQLLATAFVAAMDTRNAQSEIRPTASHSRERVANIHINSRVAPQLVDSVPEDLELPIAFAAEAPGTSQNDKVPTAARVHPRVGIVHQAQPVYERRDRMVSSLSDSSEDVVVGSSQDVVVGRRRPDCRCEIDARDAVKACAVVSTVACCVLICYGVIPL